MLLGKIILAERKKIGMKQIALCKGICTPSYLSKIENETVLPSKEILILLLERIGKIDLIKEYETIELEDEDAEIYTRKLNELYKKAILKKNDLLEVYKELKENEKNYLKNNYELYNLIILRLSMMRLGGIDQNIRNQINMFDQAKLNEYNYFLFTINSILLNYFDDNVKESLRLVNLLSKNINLLTGIEDWELADYYYIKAIVHSREKQFSPAFQAITKTIDFFSKRLLTSNLIDCYILLGIIYKNTKDYEKSYEIYNTALEYCVQNNISKKGIIYHNIACLLREEKNYDGAIEIYKQSIFYKKDALDICFSIIDIIEVLKITNQNDEILKWSSKAITILKQEDVASDHLYYLIVSLYFYFYSNNEKWEDIGQILYSRLEKQKNLIHLRKYTGILADFYYKNRKYKKSCELYKFYFEGEIN